ncbi:MAG: extra-cytoplasmic solute receptor family protein [Rhodospirillales bacterium]|nr:extra-cytoplasmic solute receptor family protein [Rhodospirillales bacterium]
MRISRRPFFATLTGAALTRPALAAGYPDRAIRFIVPFATGGNADQVGRITAPGLANQLGQPVVVENRGGAGGSIGALQVARSRPDGYTLLLGSNGPMANNPAMQNNLGYDPERDLAPIGLICRTAQVLAVTKDMPVRNLAEYIDYAKARAGLVTCSSSGNGSTAHFAMELFCLATGTRLQHVPYASGGAALPDLLSGNINSSMTELTTALPLHRAGAIRILGVSSGHRSSLAPELPTFDEAGVPGYRAAAYLGLVVPAGAPAEVLERLTMALRATVTDPATRRRFVELGSEMAEPEEATPAGFAAFLRVERTNADRAAEAAELRR